MLRLDNPTSSNLGSGVGFFCFCFSSSSGESERRTGKEAKEKGMKDRLIAGDTLSCLLLHNPAQPPPPPPPLPTPFPSLPPLLDEIVITIITAVNLTHPLLSHLASREFRVGRVGLSRVSERPRPYKCGFRNRRMHVMYEVRKES